MRLEALDEERDSETGGKRQLEVPSTPRHRLGNQTPIQRGEEKL